MTITRTLLAALLTTALTSLSVRAGHVAVQADPLEPPRWKVAGERLSTSADAGQDAIDPRKLAADALTASGLRPSQRLDARLATGVGLSEGLASDGARPVSLGAADLDGDGIDDLVCGYATPDGGRIVVFPGNVDSHFPRLQGALERKARGAFVDGPFLSEVAILSIPAAPDFLATTDFDGDGRPDVIAAAAGDAALWLLRGDGHGGLVEGRRFALPGIVTALAAGEIDRADGLAELVVAVVGVRGTARVLIYTAAGETLTSDPESIPLPEAATALSIGYFDDSSSASLAVAAGRNLVIAHGRTGLPREARLVKTLGFDRPILDVLAGRFASSLRAPHTVAVLTADGVVRFIQGGETVSDATAWIDDASAASSRATPAGTATARLLRTSFGFAAEEKLAVLNRSHGGAEILIDGRDNARLPRRQDAFVALEVAGAPLAILPMQLNEDALTDLVVVSEESRVPSVLLSVSSQTFTVDTNADEDDDIACDGFCKSVGPVGSCTLRAAIQEADCTPDADTILFNFDNLKIELDSQLPPLAIGATPVTIDGSVNGGSRVQIVGSGAGLTVGGTACVLRSLVISGFPCAALRLQGGSGHRVENCFIGPDPDGAGNVARNGWGIEIFESSANVIGGTSSLARNVISNNKLFGVGVFAFSSPANFNVISGNYIGTDRTGTAAIPNGGENVCNNVASYFSAGVQIGDPFVMPISQTTVGGSISTPGQAPGNVISGNNGPGVHLSAAANAVQGNVIGTNAGVTAALGNVTEGVLAEARGITNTIGGSTVAVRNVISGNIGNGVRTQPSFGSNANFNTIQGNFIGTDLTGGVIIKNEVAGIWIQANSTTVGGSVSSPGAPPGNVISGNKSDGISIHAAATVRGNLIGTKASGTVALANGGSGVLVAGSSDSVVGGSSPQERNVISGNALDGIRLDGASANYVQGNFIGLTITGSAALPNVGSGVSITGTSSAQYNTIGGLTAAAGTGPGNVISGNRQNGVALNGSFAAQNRIGGNLIGTNAAGTLPVSNWSNGVLLADSPNNTVGFSNFTSGNVISGNNRAVLTDGVEISGSGATGNFIQGNTIGTDLGGTAYLPNRGNGILVQANADNNWINSNRIVNSVAAGVRVLSTDVVGTWIRFNTFADNSGLTIDLGPAGTTPNDPLDADTGANNLQNFPSINLVHASDESRFGGGSSTIAGTLVSTPNSTFTIDVFDTAGPVGASPDEADVYIGNATCTTNASGTCSWNLATTATLHNYVTATATCESTPSGACRDTSELSPAYVLPQ